MGQHPAVAAQLDPAAGETDRAHPADRAEIGRIGGGVGERHPDPRTVLLDQLRRRTVGDEPAVAHHDDPVAEDLRLVDEVGDEHDGRPAGADQLDELPDDPPRRRVETLGQLVEEHDLRLVEQREGDEQALPLTARQGAERLVPQPVETPLGHRVGRHPAVGEEGDGLADAHPLGQVGVLQLAADARREGAAVPGRVPAEEPHRAAVRVTKALGTLDQRRLAGAVEAEDAEDLALVDGEVDAVDGDEVAVPLGQLLDLQQRSHGDDGTDGRRPLSSDDGPVVSSDRGVTRSRAGRRTRSPRPGRARRAW